MLGFFSSFVAVLVILEVVLLVFLMVMESNSFKVLELYSIDSELFVSCLCFFCTSTESFFSFPFSFSFISFPSSASISFPFSFAFSLSFSISSSSSFSFGILWTGVTSPSEKKCSLSTFSYFRRFLFSGDVVAGLFNDAKVTLFRGTWSSWFVKILLKRMFCSIASKPNSLDGATNINSFSPTSCSITSFERLTIIVSNHEIFSNDITL
ncbi:hypothetical protein LELG_04690 [Lodderomyces elongisporus NRRL YB-4239]|uniref:Uncharacterized protein n=1 Tax=Lodderomyces elongisporus (strain ATCC 11503 / CBS 2605 / JCM 1781 / NBRC 1676 / NRRL YB-4239) TaxID=379508 RepID=A5E501_LODEL|nr:hypothetical protein LELG_04690 [Lodderomyces elongisporus NRRL YB-4239]